MPERKPSGDRTPSQRETDHASLARLSETLVPALVQKLTTSGLGELEVREDSWHVRLRRQATGPQPPVRRPDRPRLGVHPDRDGRLGRDGTVVTAPLGHQAGSEGSLGAGTGREREQDRTGQGEDRRAIAASSAVGVFSPAAGVGARVRAGDRVGVVDLLGIPQDVPSPIDGTVVEVFPQPGEAVEYGEAIAIVEADLLAAAAGPAPAETIDAETTDAETTDAETTDAETIDAQPTDGGARS